MKQRRAISIGTGPLLVVLMFALATRRALSAAQADEAAEDQLHGVISRARLSPPLRAAVRQVRFSPDGRYLLVQFESGVYVLGRQPLAIRMWIYAQDILDARFSEDSKNLILAKRDLEIARWSLSDNKKISEMSLSMPDGCLASEVSAFGDFAACLDPALALQVFRTNTAEKIFEDRSGAISGPVAALVPRSEKTALAEQFGYEISDSLAPLAGRGIFTSRLIFSRDDNYLILLNPRANPICINVHARERIVCPAPVKEKRNEEMAFIADDKIAIFDSQAPEKSEIATFPEGQLVSNLKFAASRATPMTQARYLEILPRTGSVKLEMWDWTAAQSIDIGNAIAADVVNGVTAGYSRGGKLILRAIEGDKVESEVELPAPLLPTLRNVIVSPTLDNVVVGIHGDAGAFRTSTGVRTASFVGLRGAWFASDDELYAASPTASSPLSFEKVNPASGVAVHAWAPTFKFDPKFTIQTTHFSGPAFLVLDDSALYATETQIPQFLGGKRHSELRAFASRDVREQWSRKWTKDIPVPFADPQGERIVLGWRATTPGGEALAKQYPKLKQEISAAKLTMDDAVFEVVDGASGNGVGAVLVRVGFGPGSFDFVFSVGDYLICVRDGARVTVYSLTSGEIQGRVFGYHAAASAKGGLLAASEGNRLRLFSSEDGAKQDEYLFTDEPMYTHFSADGTKLLVLTAEQHVYVLDVATPERFRSRD